MELIDDPPRRVSERTAEQVTEAAERQYEEGALRKANQALEQRHSELFALHQVGRALAATLNLRELYQVMFQEIALKLLGARTLLVVLYEAGTRTLHCGYAVVDGTETDPARFPPLPFGTGPVSETIRTREPRRVDLRTAYLHPDSQAVIIGDGPEPQSALYAPLITGDQVIGVINVQHDEAEAFHATDMELLGIVASQAAVAIKNAQLYEQVQRHAIQLEQHVAERKRAEQALRESEQRYRLIAENAVEVIWVLDMNLRVTYMSPSVTRLLGYSVEEASAQTLDETLTPDSAQVARKHFAEMLAQAADMSREELVSQSWTCELETTRKDGSTVWTETQIKFVANPDGKPSSILGVTRDISGRKRVEEELHKLNEGLEERVRTRTTELSQVNAELVREIAERRKAEETLKEKETRLRRITDNIRDMIIQVDDQEIYRYVSPSHKAILGYTAQDLVGHSIFENIHPNDVNQVMAVVRAATQALSTARMELRYRHADGHYVWLETVGSPLLDDEGRYLGSIMGSRDITERKQSEDKLRAQKQLFENLVAVARATAERPTLEATLQNALQVASTLTGAENGNLFLLEEDGRVTWDIALSVKGVAAPSQHIIARIMDHGLASWVARHRQAALVDDTSQDDRWLPLPERPIIIQSALSVPILSGSALVGVLTLGHPQPGHFDEEHLHLMQAAADQMALAVRNAQIFEAQRRTADRQTLLYQVLRAVSGQLDPDAVAKLAVEGIVKFAGWPHVCLAAPTQSGTHWEIRAAGGELAPEVGRTFPLSQGVIGRVFQTAQTQLVRDVRADPDYKGDHPTLCSELAAPVKQGERVMAVLDLESDRLAAFGTEEVQLAESLAEAIALALDNARLYERTQLELAERKQAEERLRLQSAALAAAANGIVITDHKGTILWTNPAFTALTGYATEEAIGQNPRILRSGLHDHEFYQNLWNSILGGQVWHGEVMNRRKDGSLYLEEMTVTPVRSTGDEITHFVAIKQDITERKWTENKLRETKDQLEAILQGVADGINVLDATGQLIYVNEAAARAAGYPSTQAMLRDHNPDTLIKSFDLLDESGHPFPPDQLPDRLALQGKQTRATTLCYRAKATGDKRWSVVQAAPIFGEYGQVQFIVSIMHDLTQHKQVEMALRRYATELEERNEELDAFAHTVAHDLKNPLSQIIGYSGFLEAEGATLSADELNIGLRAIVRTASKMNNILDELLLLAGVRKTEAEINPLDMAVIVAEAQRRLADMITRQQASLIIADRWPVARGHAPWVEEVWVNYISNAIKYGGQPPHIELGAEAQPGGMVRFWVRDDGDGLMPEAQARLFTPFTRLDQVRARGHGLGLSIVRRIVEKLGGQVGVESDGVPGHGCVFYFTLPGAT